MTPRRHPRPAAEEAAHARAQVRTLRIGGVRVPLYSWGSGPAVLFAHGWEGRGSQVAPFLEPLLARGYRVVSFDQPGHGDAGPGKVTVVDFARTLRAVVRELGGVHAVVGHSVGGTAAALARAEVPFGRALVTIASPLHPRGFIRQFAALLQLSPAVLAALEARLEARYTLPLSALDLRNVVHRANVPALVVHDRSDREVPFEHGETLARHWPGARFLPTEGLGLRRILRDPEVVRAVVEAASG
jgi:pimeloyl-ACP methyl ester carboxylesterase